MDSKKLPLQIEYGDSVIIIDQVSWSDFQAFNMLMTELQKIWYKTEEEEVGEILLGDHGPAFIELCQKIADLHPRKDTPGVKGFDIKPLLDDRAQLKSLFLLHRDEYDQVKPALLMTLNGLDARKKLREVEKLLDQETQTQSPVSQPNLPDSSPTVADTKQQRKSSKVVQLAG